MNSLLKQLIKELINKLQNSSEDYSSQCRCTHCQKIDALADKILDELERE